MKKLVKSALLTLTAVLATQAFAVDGFQSLKFGMALDEIKKTHKCKWEKYEKRDDRWLCKTFKFLNEETGVLAEFAENKLVQVQVMIPEQKLETVIDNLPKKYSVSTQYSEKKEGKNTVTSVKFDDDTITLQVTYKGKSQYDYTPLLIYTDKSYLKTKEENKAKNVQNEL